MSKLMIVLILSVLFLTQNMFGAEANPFAGASAGAQLNNMREAIERARVAGEIRENWAPRIVKIGNDRIVIMHSNEVESFTIKGFDYDSSTIPLGQKVAAITAEYENKMVKVSNLGKIVERINKLYADAGYASYRAYLTKQQAVCGVIKLTFGEVRPENDLGLDGKQYISYLYTGSDAKLPDGSNGYIVRIDFRFGGPFKKLKSR